MLIKVGCWDAPPVPWDFSWSNKYCIHLSTTMAISFSHFVFAMSAFKPVEISYSNTVCNNLAAEAWICLVFFYIEECWSKRLHCHMLHGILGISFTGSKFNETWKT